MRNCACVKTKIHFDVFEIRTLRFPNENSVLCVCVSGARYIKTTKIIKEGFLQQSAGAGSRTRDPHPHPDSDLQSATENNPRKLRRGAFLPWQSQGHPVSFSDAAREHACTHTHALTHAHPHALTDRHIHRHTHRHIHTHGTRHDRARTHSAPLLTK